MGRNSSEMHCMCWWTVFSFWRVATHVEPSPQHPRPVLLDLKPLDIEIRHDQRGHESDRDEPHAKLGRYLPTIGIPRDHQHANGAQQRQHHAHISVDPVEQESLVSNERNELEHHQEGRGKDRRQVHDDTHSLVAGLVVIALAGRGVAGALGAAEDTVNVQVLEPREGEAHQGTAEDEPQGCVVAFGEADGVVGFAHGAHEGVAGWSGWGSHVEDDEPMGLKRSVGLG